MSIRPNVPVINAGNLYVQGMQMSWLENTPSLNRPTVKVKAGACRDSLNVNDIVLSEDVVIVMNKYGANGLDVNVFNPATGKFYVNAFYAVYVIGDSTGYQPSAALLSFDSVSGSPNVYGSVSLPLGYDMCRRVGYVYTDNDVTNGGNILGFSQYGNFNERTVWYYNLLKGFLYAGGASPTLFTENVFEQGVPFGPAQYEVWSIVEYTPTLADNFLQMSSYNALPDTGSPTANGMLKWGAGPDAKLQNAVLLVPSSPNASNDAAVWYKSSAAGDSVKVSVIGYKDYI